MEAEWVMEEEWAMEEVWDTEEDTTDKWISNKSQLILHSSNSLILDESYKQR